jgi:putative oxidoreductase
MVACASTLHVLTRKVTSLMDTVFLIGRIVFSLLFLGSALGHFTKTDAMAQYAQYRGLPAPRAGVLVSGVVLLLGGLSVALGIYGDVGALLLAAFLVISAVVFHPFWKESDAQAAQSEQAQFMKNVALAGAATILVAVFASQTLGLTLTGPALAV